MSRKYLPFTIAKSFKNNYVHHSVADFETCFTDQKRDNVRVWAWGYLNYITGEYEDGNNINGFLDRILNDKILFSIFIIFSHKYTPLLSNKSLLLS